MKFARRAGTKQVVLMVEDVMHDCLGFRSKAKEKEGWKMVKSTSW